MFRAFLIALVLVIIFGSTVSWYKNRQTAPQATTTLPVVEEGQPYIPPGSGETVVLALGEAGTRQGIIITPIELVSDSRCPTGVQCVWAGKVEVRVMIEDGLSTSTKVFEIGMTIGTEAAMVRLLDVLPYPADAEPTAPTDYRFTFEVKKR